MTTIVAVGVFAGAVMFALLRRKVTWGGMRWVAAPVRREAAPARRAHDREDSGIEVQMAVAAAILVLAQGWPLWILTTRAAPLVAVAGIACAVVVDLLVLDAVTSWGRVR